MRQRIVKPLVVRDEWRILKNGDFNYLSLSYQLVSVCADSGFDQSLAFYQICFHIYCLICGA